MNWDQFKCSLLVTCAFMVLVLAALLLTQESRFEYQFLYFLTEFHWKKLECVQYSLP